METEIQTVPIVWSSPHKMLPMPHLQLLLLPSSCGQSPVNVLEDVPSDNRWGYLIVSNFTSTRVFENPCHSLPQEPKDGVLLLTDAWGANHCPRCSCRGWRIGYHLGYRLAVTQIRCDLWGQLILGAALGALQGRLHSQQHWQQQPCTRPGA